MGLSYRSIQKAYEIFNAISKIHPLEISSFPQDMAQWDRDEQRNPELNTVYGWDKKTDGSWENIYFFVKKPSEELLSVFNSLKDQVPNSSMCKPYDKNTDIYIIGWF